MHKHPLELDVETVFLINKVLTDEIYAHYGRYRSGKADDIEKKVLIFRSEKLVEDIKNRLIKLDSKIESTPHEYLRIRAERARRRSIRKYKCRKYPAIDTWGVSS
jgi:hypothetical protein